MFALTFLGDIIVFIAGGALIWFLKEPVTRYYKGAEDYIGILEDKIRAIKAKS
jgi:hypothetical protein